MKTLIIINGVTGTLGTACFARFSREHDTNMIGLSRQALPAEAFCKDGYLPDNILVCSAGDITNKEDCENFVKKINKSFYDKVIYIHALGFYPCELDGLGNIYVANDHDHDGVDDRVIKLSYEAFFAMTDALQKLGLPVRALIFGSIADKFKSIVHRSWWTVMGKIKERMQREVEERKDISFLVLNISSVIDASELLIRPFVFQNTNADASFWLTPHEVAEQVVSLIFSKMNGFVEDELFHKADYYEENYFEEDKYVKRRKDELGI